MHYIRKIWHFLGGVIFAILLIFSTAILVIVGTVIESKTQSHLSAAQMIYSHPLFLYLLGGYFINILISSLRRWPFKPRHVPFLLTHLGLLLVIAGVFAKSIWGLQGSMVLLEGSISNQVMIAQTQALAIKTIADPTKVHHIDLSNPVTHQNLSIRLLKTYPHVETIYPSWIDKDRLLISGYPAFPVSKLGPDLTFSEESSFIHPRVPHKRWNLVAFREVEDVTSLLKKIYEQQFVITLFDRVSKQLVFQDSFDMLEQHPTLNTLVPQLFVELDRQSAHIKTRFSLTSAIDSSSIAFEFSQKEGIEKQVRFSEQLAPFPYDLSLKQTPTLVFAQEPNLDCWIFLIDDKGDIQTHFAKAELPSSIVMYQQGFKGYCRRAEFFQNATLDFNQQQALNCFSLAKELLLHEENASSFAEPLQFFWRGCKKVNLNPIELLLDFLVQWDESQTWLWDTSKSSSPLLNELIEKLDFNKLSNKTFESLAWYCELCHLVQEKGIASLPPVLDSKASLEEKLYQAGAHLFLIDQPLPPSSWNRDHLTISQKLHLLTAYFRMFRLHLKEIATSLDVAETQTLIEQYQISQRIKNLLSEQVNTSIFQKQPSTEIQELLTFFKEGSRLEYSLEEIWQLLQTALSLPFEMRPIPLVDKIEIEAPLWAKFRSIPPLAKLEDNTPLGLFEISTPEKKELLALRFEKNATGLFWPIFNGNYLLRFQPLIVEIPYDIRLHDGRQINYAHSNQSFSFESDVEVIDRLTQETVEKTLSMNHVHETPDGYRFYMSSLYPPEPTQVQQVQFAVNHDPYKYFLTYPGAMILTIGILFVFWGTRGQRKN